MDKYSFRFTAAEAQQLLSYVEHRDQGNDAGWYFGHKGSFEQRHERIKRELRNLTRAAVQADGSKS